MTNSLIPLVTPFTDDQSQVSEVRLARLIRSLLPHEPKGFLLCGDLGEFSTLTNSERKGALEVALRECAGTTPIWVNVTTLTSMAAMDIGQHASHHGVAGCVVMPPYYGSLTQEELVHHFRMIAKFGPAQMVIVDPLGGLTQESRDQLAQFNGTSFATGTLDEFVCDSVSCTPGMILNPDAPEAATAAMKKHGMARFAKAALQYRDLDVGPTRAPAQLTPVEVVKSSEF